MPSVQWPEFECSVNFARLPPWLPCLPRYLQPSVSYTTNPPYTLETVQSPSLATWCNANISANKNGPIVRINKWEISTSEAVSLIFSDIQAWNISLTWSFVDSSWYTELLHMSGRLIFIILTFLPPPAIIWITKETFITCTTGCLNILSLQGIPIDHSYRVLQYVLPTGCPNISSTKGVPIYQDVQKYYSYRLFQYIRLTGCPNISFLDGVSIYPP